MFSDRFRALFTEQYRMIREGTYYTVWTCRNGQPDRPVSPARG
jgi:hypothetical protein